MTVDRGRVSAARGNGDADCVVRTDKALFTALATGAANPVAAYLRAR